MTNELKAKRQRRKVGNILEIKIKDDLYGYSVEINEKGYVAFFNYFIPSPNDFNVDKLLSSNIIYKFIISRYLIIKTHFKIIDSIDVSKLDVALKQEYIRDIPTGRYRLYKWPDKDIPTTEEYVRENKLQPVIIFDGEHQVIELLTALYDKKPCRILRDEPWLDPYAGQKIKRFL